MLLEIYSTLHAHYGNLNWWPASSPYEVMVGAILTQNTARGNVEKAIANFDGNLSPKLIEDMTTDELIKIIRPAGFFNQKAMYLKELTAWYKQYGYSVRQVQKHELTALRLELLALKGIGPETADSILLYAFEFPTFVVDAYTKRLLTRLGAVVSPTAKPNPSGCPDFFPVPVDVKQDYNSIKELFTSNLPKDTTLYNNFHALIVINAKEHCKAKPKCEGCPLIGMCTHERNSRG